MAKKLYIIIVVIIVAALVGLWWRSVRRSAVEVLLDASDINRELEDLDVGDINTEFEQIDQELDTL